MSFLEKKAKTNHWIIENRRNRNEITSKFRIKREQNVLITTQLTGNYFPNSERKQSSWKLQSTLSSLPFHQTHESPSSLDSGPVTVPDRTTALY